MNGENMKLIRMLKTLVGLAPTCEQVNDFIARYLDGVLDDKTARRFVAHLDGCPDCSRYLEEYRRTIELVCVAGSVSPPDALVERTISFLKNKGQDSNSNPA